MAKSNDDKDLAQMMENDYQLKKILTLKSDEQLKIEKTKDYWRLIKKKIKVIRMMQKLGGDKVL